MTNDDKPPSRPGYLLNCSVAEKLEFFAVCDLLGAVPASYMRQWMRAQVNDMKRTRPSDFAEALVRVQTEAKEAAASVNVALITDLLRSLARVADDADFDEQCDILRSMKTKCIASGREWRVVFDLAPTG